MVEEFIKNNWEKPTSSIFEKIAFNKTHGVSIFRKLVELGVTPSLFPDNVKWLTHACGNLHENSLKIQGNVTGNLQKNLLTMDLN